MQLTLQHVPNVIMVLLLILVQVMFVRIKQLIQKLENSIVEYMILQMLVTLKHVHLVLKVFKFKLIQPKVVVRLALTIKMLIFVHQYHLKIVQYMIPIMMYVLCVSKMKTIV